jgi:hypothetical protein
MRSPCLNGLSRQTFEALSKEHYPVVAWGLVTPALGLLDLLGRVRQARNAHKPANATPYAYLVVRKRVTWEAHSEAHFAQVVLLLQPL